MAHRILNEFCWKNQPLKRKIWLKKLYNGLKNACTQEGSLELIGVRRSSLGVWGSKILKWMHISSSILRLEKTENSSQCVLVLKIIHWSSFHDFRIQNTIWVRNYEGLVLKMLSSRYSPAPLTRTLWSTKWLTVELNGPLKLKWFWFQK